MLRAWESLPKEKKWYQRIEVDASQRDKKSNSMHWSPVVLYF